MNGWPPHAVYVGYHAYEDMKPSAKTLAQAMRFVADGGYIYIADRHREYTPIVIDRSVHIRGGDFYAPVTVLEGVHPTIENAMFNQFAPPQAALKLVAKEDIAVTVRHPTLEDIRIDGDFPHLSDEEVIEILESGPKTGLIK